jgi:hypothetical protein
VTLADASLPGGATTTGTVTLTGPAPQGGASVKVNGSMEGQVITPNGTVMVPAGSTSATFPITAPHVNASHWVLVQASYGNDAGMHGAVLRIDPSVPAIPDILSLAIDPVSTVAGGTVRGTVGLVTPAPPGGATIFLSSDNPAAQVPTSVAIAAGNSATTFTIATSAVSSFNSANISATAGTTGKSAFLSIFPDPNGGASLAAVTPSVSSATGGSSIAATVRLSGVAGTSGATVTLSTSNAAVARVPPTVTIPAGQNSANFTITTSSVTADTAVTITGTLGGTRSAIITVLRASGGDVTPPSASVTSPAAGATVTGTVGITANASDNIGVARVDFLVDGVLLSSDATAPYAASWNTTTAANGSHSLVARAVDAANNQTSSSPVNVIASNGGGTVPGVVISGVPATIRRGQTFTATATVTNSGSSNASGYSVLVGFTPADSLRLDSPRTTTQSLPVLSPGSSGSVGWQIRADRTASATLTMTLRDAGGAALRTVIQVITITN